MPFFHEHGLDSGPLRLIIHHPDAGEGNPYPLDYPGALREAVAAEARMVADDAGSDLLESPDVRHRDMLAADVERRAMAALATSDGSAVIGAEYRDPAGIRWEILG